MKMKNNRTTPKFLLLFLIAGILHSFTALASPDSLRISGTITDSLTGTPIKGVCVKIKSARPFTLTDSLGHYALTISPGNPVFFLLPGYAPKEVEISESRFDLQLSPKQNISVEDIIGYKIHTTNIQLDTTRRSSKDVTRIRATTGGQRPATPPVCVEPAQPDNRNSAKTAQ